MGKYLVELDSFAGQKHGEWQIDFASFNVTACRTAAMYFFYKGRQYYTEHFGKAVVKLHKFLKEKNELPPERFRTDLTPLELRELGRKGEYYHVNEVEDKIDVCVVHRKFDFDKYFSLNDFEQQKMILDEIHAGMLLLAEHFGWDKKPLEISYQKCVEKNLIFQWTAISPKFSRNKQFSGEIFCDCLRYEIQTFAIIRDKNNNEIKRQLIDILSGFNYERLFPSDILEITKGKTKWENNDFVLFSKKGKEIARIKM